QAGYTEATLSLSLKAFGLAKWEETIYGVTNGKLNRASQRQPYLFFSYPMKHFSLIIFSLE
ncbi:MAG: hypothetical protein ABW072_08610, partial [Sedimenticola sp.]